MFNVHASPIELPSACAVYCFVLLKQEAKQKLRLTNIAQGTKRWPTAVAVRRWQSGDVDQPRLRRVIDLLIRKSGISSEWFQVCGTVFFDESDLSKVGLGQSQRFPVWGQRTGSVVLDMSEGGNRLNLRQSTPITQLRRENASITPGTTSDNYFRFAASLNYAREVKF